jgi:hypothetical protein
VRKRDRNVTQKGVGDCYVYLKPHRDARVFIQNNFVTPSCSRERQSVAKLSGTARGLRGRIARTSP